MRHRRRRGPAVREDEHQPGDQEGDHDDPAERRCPGSDCRRRQLLPARVRPVDIGSTGERKPERHARREQQPPDGISRARERQDGTDACPDRRRDDGKEPVADRQVGGDGNPEREHLAHDREGQQGPRKHAAQRQAHRALRCGGPVPVVRCDRRFLPIGCARRDSLLDRASFVIHRAHASPRNVQPCPESPPPPSRDRYGAERLVGGHRPALLVLEGFQHVEPRRPPRR